MDLNFEQLLAEHNQNFAEAEVFDNWMPPDGEYVVSLVKLATGSTKKEGGDFVWWRLTGRIEDVQDEKLNGREFSAGYFTSKAFGILKGAVKTLAGKLVHDLGEAHLILEAAIGKVVRVKIDTGPGKGANAGKDFTNCYIQEVLDTTTEATSAEGAVDVETQVPIEEVATEVVVIDTIDEPPVETPPEVVS